LKPASILFLIALATPLFSQDPFGVDSPAITAECDCENCQCDPCECKKADLLESSPQIDRLVALERRVAELERTSIDATEAREIATEVAEEVYQRYASKLSVGIQTANGGTRAETLSFDRPDQSHRIVLAPGETLLGYQDATGGWVSVGTPAAIAASQPAQSWITPAAEFRSYSAPVYQRRAVYVRPVVEATPIGTGPVVRGVYQGRRFQPLQRVQSCRMINGQKVCN
jgi:hypothetical protein